jgi:regulator of sirC expression with transglutaminase-like and TPR domain
MDFSDFAYQPWNPIACRLEALEYFREHLPLLHTSKGLLHCTLAISMHAFEEVRPWEIEAEVARLAASVGHADSQSSLTARIARLHEVLFEQEQYTGCSEEHYYHPRNSYFPVLLHTKRGLPITLALLYRLVAEQAGLQVTGIRSVGRFLVEVCDDHGPMLVDPFQAGRVLQPAEAKQLINSFNIQNNKQIDNYFPTANNADWLRRILMNAAHSFELLRCRYDLQAMQNLLDLLPDH